MLYLLEKLKILDLNNLLPYPKLIAFFNDKPYVIDGVKRTNKHTLNSSLTMQTALDQIKLWLDINLKHRNILDAEYIILINNIKDFNWNLYLNENLIKEYLKCNKFNSSILNYLAKNTVSKNTIKYLYTVKDEILISISKLIDTYEINPSTLKNILEYSNDIFINQNLNILEDTILLNLIKQSGISTAVNYIYEKRFYNLSKLRKELKSISTKFKTIKLKFDNSFEDNALNFSFSIKNHDDINKIKDDFNSNITTFNSLLNKYNE